MFGLARFATRAATSSQANQAVVRDARLRCKGSEDHRKTVDSKRHPGGLCDAGGHGAGADAVGAGPTAGKTNRPSGSALRRSANRARRRAASGRVEELLLRPFNLINALSHY